MTSPFADVDANADGKLSPDELKGNASMSKKLKPLDTNKDGYLSPEEYSASGSATGPVSGSASTKALPKKSPTP